MALVTEATLRAQFGGNGASCPPRYEVPAGTVVTPAARAWLIDHKIDLVIGAKTVVNVPRGAGRTTNRGSSSPHPAGPLSDSCSPDDQPSSAALVSALPTFTKPELFDVIDGTTLAEKPEHLTALRGNLLVAKDHPEIKFRGGIDRFEADLLMAQVAFTRLGLTAGVAQLGEVLRYVKQILRAEVLDEPFPPITLFSLDDAQLRYRSHHPDQYYGIPHFATSVADGEAVVILNQLRTKARQLELAAYDAYRVGGVAEPTRVDLIRALNRLSSALYLMMFTAKTGGYES